MKSNQQRAVDRLIHDTNGKLGTIVNVVSGLKFRLQTDPSNPEVLESIAIIDNARKGIMDIIDKYYMRFKNDFSDESMGITTLK